MTIGMRFWKPNGVVQFDSATFLQGACVDGVRVPYAAGDVTKTYPQFAGRTAVAFCVGGQTLGDVGWGDPAIDYNLGYPRITFRRSPYDSGMPPFYLVFMR